MDYDKTCENCTLGRTNEKTGTFCRYWRCVPLGPACSKFAPKTRRA